MKRMLITALALTFFTIAGCGDTSSTTPEKPTVEAHGENDGHDHDAKVDPKKEAKDADHTGHSH